MTENARALDARATTRSAEKSTAVSQALLAGGLIAGPLFLLVAVIQALTRSGFDLGRHPLSLLSLGDLGWIQRANFLVSGLLAVVFAVGIRRVLRSSRGGRWGSLAVGAFGVGLMAAGIFPPVAAFGFPPGTPDGMPATVSTSAVLHGVGFTLGFVSLTLACLVFSRRFAAVGRLGWALYSVATAVVALALSMWPGQDGASVRYFIAAMIAWAWTSALAASIWTGLASATRFIGAQVEPPSPLAS
jgi:hypothetical protein